MDSSIKEIFELFVLFFVDFSEKNKTTSRGAVESDEVVYKEEINGDKRIQYVYSASTPMANVTLTSAINAGTFEDKGKMESISDCVRTCGETKDCDVAFSLSAQCFNVHCFSPESCKTKPAFSTFYQPQLAYVKHRVLITSINKSKESFCFNYLLFTDFPAFWSFFIVSPYTLLIARKSWQYHPS